VYVNWYDDEAIWPAVVNMAKANVSTGAIRLYLLGKMYNVSEHTIRGVLSRRGVSSEFPRKPGPETRADTDDLASEPDMAAVVSDLEAELSERVEATKADARLRVHNRVLNEKVNDQARYELLLQTVADTVAAVAPPDTSPPPEAPSAIGRLTGTERTCAFLLSDMQVGMFVDPMEVGARLGYDQGEFHKRFRTWEHGVWQTVDEQDHLGIVKSIDIWNLGDVVENLQKRPSARLNVDIQSTTFQAIIAANTFIETVSRTRQRYPHLPVNWDQLSGNHDYVDKPGDSRPYDSWAVVVGEIMRQAFRTDPMVAITVHTERYACVQYGDMKILLTHGDGIKGSALLPWYGIDKRVARWTGYHRTMFDLVCLGHFHNRADWDTSSGTRVIVNGAFFDTSSFGASLGLSSPALQKALVITAGEGIVYERDIRLREDKIAPTTFVRRVWDPAETAAS